MDSIKIKLLTIGDSGVGKSMLLLRWAGKSSSNIDSTILTPTIGIDFKIKNMEVDGKRVKVQVWDTAGQERFRTITDSYYRNAQGILLVYDISDRESFNNIRTWMAQIHQHAERNINKILVGNKSDLVRKRVVSEEEGAALADEYGINFVETSAMNDVNVEAAFVLLVKEVYLRCVMEIGLGVGSGGRRVSAKDLHAVSVGSGSGSGRHNSAAGRRGSGSSINRDGGSSSYHYSSYYGDRTGFNIAKPTALAGEPMQWSCSC